MEDHVSRDLSFKGRVKLDLLALALTEEYGRALQLGSNAEIKIKAAARGIALIGNILVIEVISVALKAKVTAVGILVQLISRLTDEIDLTYDQAVIIAIRNIVVKYLAAERRDITCLIVLGSTPTLLSVTAKPILERLVEPIYTPRP